MSKPEVRLCFLKGCKQRVLPYSAYCSLLHSSDAVKRGEADACVYCKQFAKTPGFPTCSKTCGTLLAMRRSSDANYQSRTYSSSHSSSYSTPSTTTAPRVPNRPAGSKQNITYPCGCTVMTHVANPPTVCPICHSSGTGNSQPGGWTPTAQNSASYRNADPFQDQAETTLALVNPRYQTAGGFRPSAQSKYRSDQPPAPNKSNPRSVDPLGESEDEGDYATPNEVALPESPVVETTSGSDSAVLVNYAGVSRSNTMASVPPAYEDTEWTKVDPPSGRSSPAKDGTMLSPKSQKNLPELPPRRKGLLGRAMSSSKAAAGSAAESQESATSTSLWRRSRPESPVKTTGALGRPQNSKHSAPSEPDQAQVPSFPVFPSAPTNALGISENPDEPQKPLVVADPKVNGASEVLSNQDPLPIEYKKKKYPSGEHLYHAMKFIDARPLLAEHIRECDDPKGEAARFFYERNPGWDQMRVQKMEEVIQLKCKQHSAFKDKLRDSGDTQIYFDDPDPFWGTGPDGSGENKFGEVLMKVRATLGKGRLLKRF